MNPLKNITRSGLSVLLFACGIVYAFPQQKTTYSLQELVELGLLHNPTLAASALEVTAQEAAYQASKRLFNPELEFWFGKADSYDKLEERNTHGFTVTQPLENPFKRNRRIQMQKFAWEEVAAYSDLRALEVAHDIKNQYYSLLLLQKKHELLTRIEQAIQETHRLIQKRAELGEVKELEAIKLYVETLKAQKALTELRTESDLARENLNKLLANTLPPDFQVSGELAFEPITADEESLLSRALAGHPLITAKQLQLEQSRSNISYVKWQRLPDLALKGFRETELDGINRGLGVSLDIPLWNFKGKELVEAENLSYKSEQELNALRLDLAQEVRSRLRRTRLAEETLAIFSAGLMSQAEQSLKIAEISYREGEISLLEFLDSQRTYISILRDYVDALFSWNAEKAALEKAVGEDIQ
ncbi:MAG: TolC family protein [Candidatus Aminicenantaceae bacterium]